MATNSEGSTIGPVVAGAAIQPCPRCGSSMQELEGGGAICLPCIGDDCRAMFDPSYAMFREVARWVNAGGTSVKQVAAEWPRVG